MACAARVISSELFCVVRMCTDAGMLTETVGAEGSAAEWEEETMRGERAEETGGEVPEDNVTGIRTASGMHTSLPGAGS